MARFALLVINIILCYKVLWAQEYSLRDLQNALTEHNLQIREQSLNIEKAAAELQQAKAHENPTLSLQEVNFWKTFDIESQRRLFGNYGKYQQFGIELEQKIETAAKRKKRIQVNTQALQTQHIQKDALTAQLQYELRVAYYTYYILTKKEKVNASLLNEISRLVEKYQRQYNNRNVLLPELMRAQNTFSQLQKEAFSAEEEKKELLNELKYLTGLNTLSESNIVFDTLSLNYTSRIPSNVLELALQNNHVLKHQTQMQRLADANIALEKAMAVPSVTLLANYDRGGNIMKDFVGFGISIDLPIFHRNKGNILAAQHQKAIEENKYQSIVTQLEQQINNCITQIKKWEQYLSQYSNNFLKDDYQSILAQFWQRLQQKQITLTQYIDYIESHQSTAIAYWDAALTYLKLIEQLQLLVGKHF
ncbi:hypothetical protein PIECOFPK_00581 [Mycovorax composti]|jgi:Outer membrane protein|uniref:TolC family protein n=2 Tax=Chitinophagaceae TaxID=563835 RepID=A0ABZ2EHI4_9BACT